MRSLSDRTPLLALAGLLACCSLLASCNRDAIAPTTPPGPPAVTGERVLGLVEVTISGIGSDDMRASASAVGPSVPGATARGLSLDLTPVPGADGSIQLAALSSGGFTEGKRGSGGERYLYATFKVRNATSDGTAYSTPRDNLTFLAVSTPSTIEGTAISRMNKFDGSTADPGIALHLLPTGAVTQNPATGELSSASSDVLQVLTEAEAASFTAPPSVTTVFPYGFVVRNPNTGYGRALSANPGPNQFDGRVTFAFRVPLQASAADDPFTVSALFVAVDDGERRITQSLEEQDPAGQAALAARVLEVGADEVTLLPGGSYTGTGVTRRVCSVRTAGPASAPTATLVNSTGALLRSLSPNPYATDGSGTFIASPTQFAATFSSAVGTPTAENFAVNGSESGRHFLHESYSGGGTSTITSPSGTFFPGEEVEVVLTNALQGCGAPTVARLHVKTPTPSSGPTPVGRSFEVGADARSLPLGDLNGDGKLDAVTANYGDNTVSVLLGDGEGGFQAHADFATGAEPQFAALGDLNGDGKLDIVTANFLGRDVSVLLGAGDGTFPTHTEYAVAAPYPVKLAIGDLNGDGKLDLVVGTGADALTNPTGAISVLLGNGDGTFQVHKDYTTAYSVVDLRLGDLNGDGALDVATTLGVIEGDPATQDMPASSVSVLLGNGDGSFQRQVEYTVNSGSREPADLAIGDVNGDGIPDLVAANIDVDNPNVSVLLGNGNGTFQQHVDYSTGGTGYLNTIAIGDLNGDGTLDVAVSRDATDGMGSGSVSVLLGRGDGTFPTNMQLQVDGPYPETVATGDLNGDGKLDVLFTLAVSGNDPTLVQTMMNQ